MRFISRTVAIAGVMGLIASPAVATTDDVFQDDNTNTYSTVADSPQVIDLDSIDLTDADEATKALVAVAVIDQEINARARLTSDLRGAESHSVPSVTAPADDTAPADSASDEPEGESAGDSEQSAVEDGTPSPDEGAPDEDVSPTDGVSPVEQTSPTDEAADIEDAAPVEESAPTDGETPTDGEAPETEPAEEQADNPAEDATYDEAPDWESFPADDLAYPDAAAIFDPDGDGRFVIPEPTQGGEAAGPVPAGLEKYYNQQVHWTRCDERDIWGKLGEQEIDAGWATYGGANEDGEYVNISRSRSVRCGYVIVPVDYAQPDGERMAVFFLQSAASNVDRPETDTSFDNPERTTNGLLFVNPGGPGGDAVSYASNLALSGLYERHFLAHGSIPEGADFFDTISDETFVVDPENYFAALTRFDIVGVSPRGTIKSMPSIICNSGESDNLRSTLTLSPEDDAAFNEWVARECMTNSVASFDGIDGRNFIEHAGVINTARDMDVVRAVLGQEKLNYYGVSYGTRLGNQYQSLFPNNYDRMLLDSSENQLINNPNALAPFQEEGIAPAGEYNRGVAQYRALDTTFRSFIANCLPQDECALRPDSGPISAGDVTDTDIQRALDYYTELVRSVPGNDAYTADRYEGRTILFHDLSRGTLYAMYSTDRWKDLRGALQSLATDGDASELLALGDRYYRRTWNPDLKELEYSEDSKVPNRFETLLAVDIDETMRTLTDTDITRLIYEAAPWQFAKPLDEELVEYARYADLWLNTEKALSVAESVAKPLATLIMANADDFATPMWQSVVQAKLNQGYLLITPSADHGAYFVVKCASAIGSHFLDVGPEQFDKDYASGLFTSDERFTGATDVATRDIYSNPTTANECQLLSFRPSPDSDVEVTVPVEVIPADSTGTAPDGDVPITGTVTDVDGHVIGTVTAPDSDSASSEARVPADDQVRAAQANAEALPHTGASVAPLVLLALLLVAAGSALTVRRAR